VYPQQIKGDYMTCLYLRFIIILYKVFQFCKRKFAGYVSEHHETGTKKNGLHKQYS
jgi:hypothetical protein